MPGIDDVIARSRQPGGFVERKCFAVARSRAIEKLRRFALADPHYYILELIQGAIANGASYVDLELSSAEVRLSYVGGGFAPDELAQLFDFLFASKENVDFADVRQLALGLNALLLFRPDEVVIESGNGTPKGTTRVRIDGRSEAVEVGRPEGVLRGTFLRASGLHRGLLGRGPQLGELSAIEERCLTAPVSIIVNSEPIFGWGHSRVPRLPGYGRTLSFDEGDLYGTIGLAPGEGYDYFKLLTWGVWVDAVRADVLPGIRLGGIVGFDRLHKTADHAAVVQDDRLQELWTRLRPYARMLAEGRRGTAAHEMWTLDGRALRSADIRETFRRCRTVVAVARHGPGGIELRARRAGDIGTLLGVPTILLGADDAAALRLLGGPEARVIQPDVSDERDVEFYRQPAAPPPERPWLISPVELEPLPVARLVELLEADGSLLAARAGADQPERRALAMIGAAGDVRATIYVPEHSAYGGELWVETLVTGRRACAGSLLSSFPGFVLRIEAPDVSPQLLLWDWPSRPGTTVAGMIAYAVVQRVAGVLETAVRRLLAGIGQLPLVPGSTAARILLATLARTALKRLRTEPSGGARVRFALLDPELPDALLDVPLLRTLDGTPRSLRHIEELAESTGGLVYGAVTDVAPDLRDLDTSRILDLDRQQERLLVALLGETSYVRVDARDVLAEHQGVRCRDVAFGLRSFPNFPLLVEGADPSAWPEADRVRCEQALVDRLIEVLRTGTDEELRRQAVRHLLWYQYRRAAHHLGGPDDRGVSRLPLFMDVDGVGRSFAELQPLLASPAGVAMYDGWSTDASDLGPLAALHAADAAPVEAAKPFRGLAMNPFTFHLLSRLGRVRPMFDFDLSDAEALADPAPPVTAFVAQVQVQDEIASGTIGIPVLDVAEPAIEVVEPQRRRVIAVQGAARDAGVVGRLLLRTASPPSGLLGLVVERAVAALLGELARRLAALTPGSPEHERCARAGLRLAGRKVALTAEPDGSVALSLLDPTARRLLDLPLFPTTQGVAASAWRFLQEFAVACSTGVPPAARTALAADAPAYLRAWLDETLIERRIVRPACNPAPAPAFVVAPLPGMPEDALGGWLTEAMRRIHGELGVSGPPPEVSVARPGKLEGRRGLAIVPAASPAPSSVVPELTIDADHWLVERTRRRSPEDPEAAAWLLLACYAQLNADLQSITNRAELGFQERVLDLLERGELPPPDVARSR